MKIAKKNIRVVVAFVIGLLISGVGVYALTIASKDVSYDNTNSHSTNTNVQGAIDELYSRVGNINSADISVILDRTSFNNDNFSTLIVPYLHSNLPDGTGSYIEGHCTPVKVNMDLLNKISIEKIQHYHTWAPIAYIAFFDEYTDDFDTIKNNATSSKSWSGNTANSWVHTTINWEINTSSIKGYKYIAIAYTQQNASYSNHIIFLENVTIN